MRALLVVGFGAAACSTTVGPDPGPDPDTARAYYEDYREDQDDQGAAAPPVAVDSAAENDAGPAGAPSPPPPAVPGVLDDNVFVDSGQSRWTTTAEDRESTFGLDVDTGSFTVARTLLFQGHRPDPDAIRVEEWVNAFDYGDPLPSEDTLGVTVEAARSPRAEDGTTLVRIGVSAREIAAAERPPAHVTFVVDTSGSMDIRERLGLVQSSLALLVDSLEPDDTVAIVTYGSSAEPLLPPTPVRERATVLDAVDRLRPGGSTNLEAGLTLGYEQARATLDPDAVNTVVLASDGVANVGATDPTVLTEITQGSEDGIHLVSVGYGMGNYNDVLMEQLADQGDGFYAYVDTFEEAERLFVEELTSTLTVVAHDSKVQVVFDEERVERYRLVGYANRRLDDAQFTDDSVDAGELGAGHQVSALYEVVAAPGADPGAPLGEVRLRWAEGDGEAAREITASIPAAGDTVASDPLRLAALVADTAEVLRGDEVVSGRGVTVDQLHAEAEDLASRDVDGAGEILLILDLARSAEPAPREGDDDR